MEQKIELFKKVPETKAEVGTYFTSIKNRVLDGEVDPLTFGRLITGIEKLFSSLKKDVLIKDCILEAAEKYSQKSFEHEGAKYTVKEVGVKYDFTNCQDSVYEEIMAEYKEVAQKKKDREDMLKKIDRETAPFGDDGRQLEPPVKTSTTQVVITLK